MQSIHEGFRDMDFSLHVDGKSLHYRLDVGAFFVRRNFVMKHMKQLLNFE